MFTNIFSVNMTFKKYRRKYFVPLFVYRNNFVAKYYIAHPLGVVSDIKMLFSAKQLVHLGNVIIILVNGGFSVHCELKVLYFFNIIR